MAIRCSFKFYVQHVLWNWKVVISMCSHASNTIANIVILTQITKKLSGKVLVETARYQLAKEALVKVCSVSNSHV